MARTLILTAAFMLGLLALGVMPFSEAFAGGGFGV